MKWSIDWILRKFYFFTKQILLSLIRVTCVVFSFLYPIFTKTILLIISLLKGVLNITPTFIINFFISSLDIVLFIFISIPYFFYCEFLKPLYIYIYDFLTKNLNKWFYFGNFLSFILPFFFKHINVYYTYIHYMCVFFYKNLIDFLFFYIYRNRVKINKIFYNILINFIGLVLIYFFFYQNTWGCIFNFFFFKLNDSFVWWDVSTTAGLLYIFISFLNIDNIIMYIYILFFEVGVGKIFSHSRDENLMIIGIQWINYYTKYKLDNLDFCFFKHLLDNLFYYLYNINLYETFIDAWSIPIFFYFGFLFFFTVISSWFFFSYLGLYGMFKLNIITLSLFWLSLLFSAKSILINNKIYIIKLCSWAFLSSNTKIDYYFLIDTISFSFMLLTTTIALFVYIYAFSYFRYEPLVDRFLLFILSFVISMIFLVTSGNTIMLFLGWELIGLTSFCLINFWTTKVATLKSAFKAFTFNKVSDFFMFMFLLSTYTTFYTFDILSLNQQIYKYEYSSMYLLGTPINLLEFISFMIIGAAFIKSAQIGGHVWLPDSMEAPVPASSLIHSATLVSAGVYLILRFNFIFDVTQYSKFIIPVIGSLTAAYGGVCAAAQSDIKKTLAYSTISHCGFLMVLCSTEMNEFTILYLYVHGFFKAGVFMCVGNVLRITRGYQDTRRMGGLLKYLPFEYYCATIGLLNLAGLPFTFGFFIKHILLVSLDTHLYLYLFVIFNSLVGAFSGLFYSYRIINYTFGDFKKGNKVLYLNLSRINYNSKFYTNSSLAATLSIFFLFIFSYIITYFMFFYLLSGNFLFSDYMNTTLLSNYYSTTNSFVGYLLNFSYINITVMFIFFFLIFSKFRKIPRQHALFNMIFQIFILLLFLFSFYNFL